MAPLDPQSELEILRAERVRERAIERLHNAVLFMRSSADLLQVVLTMYRQLAGLGIEADEPSSPADRLGFDDVEDFDG